MDLVDVLIIDSDPAGCRAVAGAVQRMGLRVDIVHDAAHGLMMARERFYTLVVVGFDLAASDAPGAARGVAAGIEILRAIAAADPTQRVLATGAGIDEAARRALEEMPHVVGYVEDPASAPDLVDRIRLAL